MPVRRDLEGLALLLLVMFCLPLFPPLVPPGQAAKYQDSGRHPHQQGQPQAYCQEDPGLAHCSGSKCLLQKLDCFISSICQLLLMLHCTNLKWTVGREANFPSYWTPANDKVTLPFDDVAPFNKEMKKGICHNPTNNPKQLKTNFVGVEL